MSRPSSPGSSIRGRALLASLPLLLLAACGGPDGPAADGGVAPFVLRSLDLRHQDPLGRPSWALSSPEARYSLVSRVAQADNPRGVIYRDGQPAYRLTARSGTVLNDGQLVLLEGEIRIERLGRQPWLLRALRARWLPQRSVLELDRQPQALDGHNRLSARRARFLSDRELLELQGAPRIDHWSQRSDPMAAGARGLPDVVLTAGQASWHPQSGQLQARGPVRALRRVSGRAASAPEQTVTASAISGNTIQQRYTLQAPVQLRDPAERLTLLARDVQLDLRNQVASTAAAGPGADRVAQEGALPPQLLPGEGCLLVRGGDSLRAARCRWAWATDSIRAEGGVLLRRQQPQQLSRGDVLEGTLTRSGTVRLSTPDGRVLSRFQVPRQSGRPVPPPAPPRREPEPIRL